MRGTVFSKGSPNHEKIRRFEKDDKLDGEKKLYANYFKTIPLMYLSALSRPFHIKVCNSINRQKVYPTMKRLEDFKRTTNKMERTF